MMEKTRGLLFPEVCLLSILMGLFGLFLHTGFPLILISITGFIFVCFIIAYRLFKNSDKSIISLAAFFGIKSFTKKSLLYTGIGFLIGLILSAALRLWNKVPLVPGTITLFAIGVAPLIGISEELLFRGYIQNRLYKANSPAAVLIAALSHAIYKSSIMVVPPLFNKAAIPFFALWTFAAGILFGMLSEKSQTVYPALAAHAVFDIVVYSTLETAPWWVW